MITLKEAYQIVINSARETNTERVNFINSLGRILAEDIFSDSNIPSFNKSTMDGYAYKNTDTSGFLKVIETIQAGYSPTKIIKKAECSKIMTGAEIPEGADCVVQVENTQIIETNLIKIIKQDTKTNIRYLGEDLHSKEKVLIKGTLIRSQEIAAMATVGCVNPLLFSKPVVGIISTGNELVEPDKVPAKSQIRNSNACQLTAQCQKLGILPIYFGIANDSPEELKEKIIEAENKCDVILLTGGVSMGEFDYVPQILAEVGFVIKFKNIAVQPGKPTLFCVKNNKFCFGLPGNPVSSFMQFELLVIPLLYKMMGHLFKPSFSILPFDSDYKRKNNDRELIIPVLISSVHTVVPVKYHGSGHLFALNSAHGFIRLPVDVLEIKKGENVIVRQI